MTGKRQAAGGWFVCTDVAYNSYYKRKLLMGGGVVCSIACIFSYRIS